MSAGVYQALRENKGGRSWEAIVGYTLAQLVSHLERQFVKGMTWANYGEWHIDHVRPISSFSFSTGEDPDFKACWAMTNLRPLWAKPNIQKGGKVLLLL